MNEATWKKMAVFESSNLFAVQQCPKGYLQVNVPGGTCHQEQNEWIFVTRESD